MPPPTTSIFFGIDGSVSAPVESTTRGSSGMNGSFTASLPAAMIAFWKRTTFLSPVVSRPVPDVACTSTWCGSRKRPMPRTTSTLRAFAMPIRPPVSFLTTPSLNAAELVEVDLPARRT